MTDVLRTDLDGSVLTVTFQHRSAQNPMSRALERAIIEVCAEVAADDRIGAVVLTGGAGRSFCAGGDFTEVAAIDTPEAVDDWIDRIMALYVAVLRLDKPVVAAMDGHAIGMGFQLALCCDLRLATPDANIVMWELKHGVACTIGAYMLGQFLGRAAMTHLVYTCEPVDPRWAVACRLLTGIAPPEELPARARQAAAGLAACPAPPFRRTKQAINAPFIDGLLAVGPVSKQAHRAAFAARSGTPHFERILGRGPVA